MLGASAPKLFSAIAIPSTRPEPFGLLGRAFDATGPYASFLILLAVALGLMAANLLLGWASPAENFQSEVLVTSEASQTNLGLN
jgi:hypothetical protein